MNIVLIRPPILQLTSNFSSYGAVLPIGLAYVAAILRDDGHKIFVIDAAGEALDRFEMIPCSLGKLMRQGLPPDEIIDFIPSDTQVIGFTNMFLHEWPTIREISEKIKKKYPFMIIILGGENATNFWGQIFKETNAIEYCVLGEGEKTISGLIKGIESGTVDFSGGGVAFYKKGQIQAVSLSKRMVDIKSLPLPAWEFFPVENYLSKKDTFGVNRGRSMPILATRGCPYDCSFCSNTLMWGRRFVERDPADVVAEIKMYVERHAIDNVNFCDLTGILRKEWMLQFTTLLDKQCFSITWQLPTGMRSETLDAEVLQHMYKTGCRNITYAPESGSERMLKIFRKKVNLSKMLGSLKVAHKIGLVTRVNIIIGHPEERTSDIFLSLLFLVRATWLGCNDASVMIFSPYPGSQDTNNLIQQGKLIWDDKDTYYLALARSGKSLKTYNPFIRKEILIFFQYLLALIFHLLAYLSRPWRIFNAIYSFYSGKENTQIDQLFRTKLYLMRRQ